MFEANPIGQYLASLERPVTAIVIFKVSTVTLAVGILYALRRRATALMAARLMVCVLGWLVVHWILYGVVTLDLDWVAMAEHWTPDAGWVRLK